MEFSSDREQEDTSSKATQVLLPEKSKELYDKEYNLFMECRWKKQVSSFTDRLLL